MSDIRVQVQIFKSGDLPVDHITNTVYFRDLNVQPGSTDWQSIANSVRDVFRGRPQHPIGFMVSAKAYNMDDAKPRPIKATAAPMPITQASASESGPREVALCLSYYAEQNVPRRRGRLYIGPFTDASMEIRPPAGNAIGATASLAPALAGVGGADVDWCVYSPTDDVATAGATKLRTITHWWIDNEWDTVRSRGRRATSRITGVTGE